MSSVHDGLDTTIVDEETGEALPEAFVFNGLNSEGKPNILAYSDDKGHVLLQPERRIVMVPFLGEAIVQLDLWACKDGYQPKRIVSRGGWNADLGDSHLHSIPQVSLLRSSSKEINCAAITKVPHN